MKTGLSSNYHCCSTIIQDIQYSAHTAFSSIHSDTMVLQAEKLKKPLKRCNDVIRFPSLCLPACLLVCSCGVMIPSQRQKFPNINAHIFFFLTSSSTHWNHFLVSYTTMMLGQISKCYHERCVTIAVIYLHKCHFCAIWWKIFYYLQSEI